uniref:Remorin C-terminal domain-containing protein n=1 Tax=Leersia perrieri TaxID=77586 RepID=A0A0D9XIL3_9ORYZ
MDDSIKHLRVRFPGAGQNDQGGSQTIRMPPQQGRIFGREEMSNGEEYDAAYAATVAAVAFAIAAREEEKQASQETPVKEKLTSQKRPIMNDEPSTTPTLKLPPMRDGILKKPRATEGSRISRRSSGKELVTDDDDDELEANVLVRRPVKPAQKKPEGRNSGQNVVGKIFDSAPSIRKDPSFAKPLPQKKVSTKFEQEQAITTAPPNVRPTASFPREKKESKKSEQDQAIPMVPPVVRPTASFPREKKDNMKFERDKANQMPPISATPTSSYSSEVEATADAWEKEKLAKIKKQYNMTMDTIAEWEAEKKAKAKRQMEQKEGDNSERKREKALEEYNDEMTRINKVAAASRLTAEEKRRSAERKVRDKAESIRVTGKLPRSCGCF